MDLKNLRKAFAIFYLFLFLSGCLSVGSGPLTNLISIPSGQTKVKHKLPSGFCLDRSANSFNSLQETLVVTNCIAVNNGGKPYFSRRPVDTIVNITFTQSKIPKNVSQEKYLLLLAEKMEFEKTLIASSKKKLIYGEERLQKKLLHINFQRANSSHRKEYVRKYLFLVDNKVAIMTIMTFQKPRRNTYSSFENFIRKISEFSS